MIEQGILISNGLIIMMTINNRLKKQSKYNKIHEERALCMSDVHLFPEINYDDLNNKPRLQRDIWQKSMMAFKAVEKRLSFLPFSANKKNCLLAG
jgi:hypothetical protein